MTQYDEYEGRPKLTKQKERADRFTAVGKAALLVYVVLSLAILIANALTSFSSRHTLLDCTTEGGSCYQRGQDQTKVAIQQLVDVIVYASLCADQPNNETKKTLHACINRHMQP